jgi:putative iron-dependent peroxidase
VVFVQDGDLAGSSFIAAQQRQHQFSHFHAMNQTQKIHILGRRLSGNEDLDDAPDSAHAKRTAQEDFLPETFVLRRVMP